MIGLLWKQKGYETQIRALVAAILAPLIELTDNP
jgi:hypothetical protein